MSVAQPLRISYIDLRSAKDVEYIEVLFPGCRRSIRRQDKNHFREEFPEPLTVQGEALSFSVHRKKRYPFRIPAVDNIQIDVREVLSDSRPHKFQTKRSKLDITIGLSSNRLSADVVPAQDNPTPPNTNSLRATTEELLDQCPRFRILVIGQSGVGKSTLLQRVFGIDQASAENLKPGAANIEEELISPQNDRFVLHDSNGFEPGDNVNYDAVRSFITDRKKRKHVKDQLHAVWLCFRMPIKNRGDRLLEDGAEAFLEKDTSVLQNIPTIVVFTKYDKLLTHMQKEQKANPEAAAEQYLKEHCYAPIEELAGGADLSYVAVSSFENPGLDERRRRLINLTHRKVIERFRLQTDTPSPVSIVFLLAQRMLSDSPGSKLLRSIDVGRRRYWRMLTRTSGVDFDDHTITECLAVIHTDTVCVWEFDDPLQYLYSDEFRGLMANLAGTIDGFTSEFPRLSRIDTTSSNFSTPRTGPRRLLTPFTPPFEAGPGLVPRTRQSYQQPPNAHHKFMAYTVDLVHVLEILSSLTANSNEKKLTRGAVSSAFDVYYDLEMRYNVHRRIKGFDYRIPGRNTVLDEIISLVTMSPINDNDISSALQNIPLESLAKDEWLVGLEGIIACRRSTLQLTPEGHPNRAVSLANLLCSLHERFTREHRMEDLQEIIDLRRSALQLTPEGHPERVVSLVNLADSLHERFKREGGMEDLQEIITLRRSALQLTPEGHPERVVSLVNLADSLHERFERQSGMEDLQEIIDLRRSALKLAPKWHQKHAVALVNLADGLHERFERQSGMDDLQEIIDLRRSALQLIPEGHPERVVSLVNLADSLQERFRRESGMEDLQDIIALRRSVLQFTPPGHPGRFLSLVNFSNSLHERFIKGGTLADLDEIIAFRRAASECTAPTPSDRCMLLLNLANSLREKYQKLGLDADLEEAIKYACAASVGCPSEQDASCRDCVASCVQLKAKKSRLPVPTVQATDSAVRPSGVKQIVQSIVAEITQTLPLRLLNTYTGVLCDRDAQISCFEDSAQYKELQSFKCDNPECEQSIRKTISKYFGYTTLSHRWGPGEPLLRNVQGVNIYSLDDREGFAKLQSFCAFTLQHGYRWAWSDTCCIDKDSSSELQEAIGSMFAWYRNSALTIVYLADVSGTTSFADSIWFKRGWTLQELLASPRVLFYTQDWSLYMNCTSSNHKSDAAILTELQKATGIGELQLKNFSPGMHDVRSKLQWASMRHTTRAEDVAYSLFGIFQVSLPVIYGENTPGALGRLLAEIVSRSGDVSALDWVGEASSLHSCCPNGLTPYRTRSWIQSVPSGPSEHNDADLEKGRELYNALARLSSPRFVSGRLELPCIVHRVARVKLLETSSPTSYHDYEIVASGLVPLKLKLSSRLQEGSGAGLPYVLVRPWSPKLLDLLAHDDVLGSLLEWLRQPFNALLLQSPLHTEYKRIASDCSIIARIEDLVSAVHSECQTLEIV